MNIVKEEICSFVARTVNRETRLVVVSQQAFNEKKKDAAPMQHHTIEIVLVGDSGVTKTGLGLLAIKPLPLLLVCGYCTKDSLKCF